MIPAYIEETEASLGRKMSAEEKGAFVLGYLYGAKSELAEVAKWVT